MAVLRLPHVDADRVREAMHDLDTSRLSAVRDELARRDLPWVVDLRQELDRIERELPDMGKLLGRSGRRSGWSLPVSTPAVVLGVTAVVGGALVGGTLAWLLQPNRGPQRRKALRRRLHKLQRMIQHRL